LSDLQQKIAFLEKYLTPRRKAVIDSILDQRTDWITIVLEDVYYAQNISAALRTAECFGIQDVHIIEQKHNYQVNPRIVRGSAKWLSLHHYDHHEHEDPSMACIEHLKQSGYTIYATSPEEEAVSLEALSFDHKAAFIFGTELTGISHSASRYADHLIKIPMYGFTESFNISVSVALVLQLVKQQLTTQGIELGLRPEKKEKVLFDWYCNSVRHAEQLLKRLEEG
jgi:tRNA (guanosine-2'-O-)-methyltransferase